MAVLYTTYRDNREDSNHLFYGRAVHLNTTDLNEIAERVQRNCSMKKSDVKAVLTEMVEVVNDELRNSNKVKIEGLGTFWLSLRSGGVTKEDDYSAMEHIKGVRVKFMAEGKRQYNGSVTRTFTRDLTFKKTTTPSKKEATTLPAA